MTWRDADKTPELGAMYSDYMAERLGPARDPVSSSRKGTRDGAASLQARLEEVLFEMLRGAARPDQAEGRMPGRRRGVQLRGQRENFRRDALRSKFSCSPLREMRGLRSAPLISCIIRFSASRALS